AGLREVAAPVLVVAGAVDALTGVAAARDVAACFPHARTVVLPDAGHFPWVDQPDAFRSAVTGFLARD
ncbi:MAG: alpha/beta hydrolase, partial [Actinomycetota bacterium]|nr:alpha/beta hydrolase [Actinomycetota bacterium]